MLSEGLGISLVASLLYVAKFFEFDKSVADRTRIDCGELIDLLQEKVDAKDHLCRPGLSSCM